MAFGRKTRMIAQLKCQVTYQAHEIQRLQSIICPDGHDFALVDWDIGYMDTITKTRVCKRCGKREVI